VYIGFEKIKGSDIKILDFWKWACSDIVIPSNRNDFALFLVANALELTKMPRIYWDNSDLRYRKKKISVKTSAFIEHWKQKRLKRLSFDISPKKGADAATQSSLTYRNRHPEIYIFVVLNQKELKKIDVLDLDQWQFYIVKTEALDRAHFDTRKLGVRALNNLASPVHHSRIKPILDDLIDYDLGERLVL